MNFHQLKLRHKRDEIYEKFAKPGNDYSIYSNKHYQGEIILDKYQVEQVFQDESSGFYALGLLPVSAENPPVLVLRGFGNWGNLEQFPREFFPYQDITDVFLTLSDEHFQAAKKVGVIQWLQSKANLEMKADLVGQSLGGKVGQQLVIEVPDYIYSLVTFNSIGISLKELEKYQGSVEIYHYLNPADLVPYVLGETFLPGIILQVYSPNIKKYDLLGQHNNLVLDQQVIIIKEVDAETFNLVRQLYKSLEKYSETVQQEVIQLSQIAKEKIIECGTSLNSSSQTLQQKIESYSETIQQELSQIMPAIQQELLSGNDRMLSTQFIQEKVDFPVEAIQQKLESLSKFVYLKKEGSDKNFNSFSQSIQQEIKEAVLTIKQKLDKFLPSKNS